MRRVLTAMAVIALTLASPRPAAARPEFTHQCDADFPYIYLSTGPFGWFIARSSYGFRCTPKTGVRGPTFLTADGYVDPSPGLVGRGGGYCTTTEQPSCYSYSGYTDLGIWFDRSGCVVAASWGQAERGAASLGKVNMFPPGCNPNICLPLEECVRASTPRPVDLPLRGDR